MNALLDGVMLLAPLIFGGENLRELIGREKMP
mgnify:CR=1 FL=1